MQVIKILLLCCCPLLGFSQLSDIGKVHISEDAGIRSMLDHRKSLNFQKDRVIKAWSVQILVTRDKYLVNQKKEEVKKSFRGLNIDWSYEEPYYRLNVGAFYTKIEAAGLLYKLLKNYPGAYIFKNNQVKPADF
ncbi:MAG: sporulation protein [Aureispira sp.]|nr:sporulation protein [Aureispira sp.]